MQIPLFQVLQRNRNTLFSVIKLNQAKSPCPLKKKSGRNAEIEEGLEIP